MTSLLPIFLLFATLLCCQQMHSVGGMHVVKEDGLSTILHDYRQNVEDVEPVDMASQIAPRLAVIQLFITRLTREQLAAVDSVYRIRRFDSTSLAELPQDKWADSKDSRCVLMRTVLSDAVVEKFRKEKQRKQLYAVAILLTKVTSTEEGTSRSRSHLRENAGHHSSRSSTTYEPPSKEALRTVWLEMMTQLEEWRSQTIDTQPSISSISPWKSSESASGREEDKPSSPVAEAGAARPPHGEDADHEPLTPDQQEKLKQFKEIVPWGEVEKLVANNWDVQAAIAVSFGDKIPAKRRRIDAAPRNNGGAPSTAEVFAETDFAYYESLKKDQEKKKKREEEAAKKTKWQEQEHHYREGIKAAAAAVANMLADQPAEGDRSAVRLSILLPQGERIAHRFRSDQKLALLVLFVRNALVEREEKVGEQQEKKYTRRIADYHIFTTLPKKDILELDTEKTFAELGLKGGSLMVEWEEDKEEEEEEK